MQTGGSVSGHDIWPFDIAVRSIEGVVNLTASSEAITHRLVWRAIQAVKHLAEKGEKVDVPALFAGELGRQREEHDALAKKRFFVLYPLFWKDRDPDELPRHVAPFRRRSWRTLRAFDLERYWNAAEYHGIKRADLEGLFAPFVATVDVRTAEEAWENTHRTLDLYRTTLNLQGTWGRVSRGFGPVRAAGAVFPPPFTGIFQSNGSLDCWYYEITPSNLRDTASISSAPRAANAALQRIRKVRGELRPLVEDGFLMYGRALDSIDQGEAFLGFWRVLELITLQSDADIRMKEVVARTSVLVERQPGFKDLVIALQRTRNLYVHHGRFDEERGRDNAQFMRSVVEVALGGLLDWSTRLRSKAELRDLFEMASQPPETLERRVKMAKHVLRRRSPGKGKQQ